MVVKVKRIRNPVTGKYYELRQRKVRYGDDDSEPKGLWASKRHRR
jgi:hypothetical protein